MENITSNETVNPKRPQTKKEYGRECKAPKNMPSDKEMLAAIQETHRQTKLKVMTNFCRNSQPIYIDNGQ